MRSINTNLLNSILKEIKDNKNVTEIMISNKYGYTERTIRRYFKILKDRQLIKLQRNGSKREWLLYK